MANTLDPTLDVVFKLLFAAAENRPILVALLQDVLDPASPIASVEVLNPDLEREAAGDRALILDILVRHEDGSRTDVEMQTRHRSETPQRALYHWARLYGQSLLRGQDFSELSPCRVVFFVAFELFTEPRVHSTFRVREVHDDEELSEDLEIHVIELPKVAAPHEDAGDGAVAWARFLAARTDDERRRIAMANPNIEKAKEALERLSQDPDARLIAELRAEELYFHRRDLEDARRRGRDEGRNEGRNEGRDEGRDKGRDEGRAMALRYAVRSLCEVLGLGWSPDRQARVDAAPTGELETLHDGIVRLRRWPE